MNDQIFISYSHRDTARVNAFLSMISKDFKNLFIDVKDISPGETYLGRIFKAIRQSGTYVVFLSQASVQSNWVREELGVAVEEKVKGNLKIIPVVLDDCEIPLEMPAVDYVEAVDSIEYAVNEFYVVLDRERQRQEKPRLSSVTFTLSKKTSVEVGIHSDSSEEEMKRDIERVQAELQKKAQGILMNFVDIKDFDLHSEKLRFKNGIIGESLKQVSEGDFVGGTRTRIELCVTTFNPNMERFHRLLSEKLKRLSISGLAVIIADAEFSGEEGKKLELHCIEKIQNKYTILSYDCNEGVKFEYKDDLYLSVLCMENGVAIKMETSSVEQFARAMEEFSLMEFYKELKA